MVICRHSPHPTLFKGLGRSRIVDYRREVSGWVCILSLLDATCFFFSLVGPATSVVGRMDEVMPVMGSRWGQVGWNVGLCFVCALQYTLSACIYCLSVLFPYFMILLAYSARKSSRSGGRDELALDLADSVAVVLTLAMWLGSRLMQPYLVWLNEYFATMPITLLLYCAGRAQYQYTCPYSNCSRPPGLISGSANLLRVQY